MHRRDGRGPDLVIVVSSHLAVDRRERPDALRVLPPTALERGTERGHAVLRDRTDFLEGREDRLARTGRKGTPTSSHTPPCASRPRDSSRGTRGSCSAPPCRPSG